MHSRGFIAAISIILIGTVAVALTVLLLYMSTSALIANQSAGDLVIAKNYAESCAQMALQALRANQNYSGTTTYSFADGGCYYFVQNSGSSATINAMGTTTDAVRKVKVSVSSMRPTVTVSSWQEMADF